jgi:hypothetical protein
MNLEDLPLFRDPALPTEGGQYIAVSRRQDNALIAVSPPQDTAILAWLWSILRGLSPKRYVITTYEHFTRSKNQ